MQVEVVYALETEQVVLPVKLTETVMIQQVIKASGLLAQFPKIDLKTIEVGIWGKKVGLEQMVRAGDRIEIYRPLTIDPMEARRIRASKKQ
jgi:putative ubiquitin-RnfH superfamily antitoxin RatB of RatAB toxin-antitoxin module